MSCDCVEIQRPILETSDTVPGVHATGHRRNVPLGGVSQKRRSRRERSCPEAVPARRSLGEREWRHARSDLGAVTRHRGTVREGDDDPRPPLRLLREDGPSGSLVRTARRGTGLFDSHIRPRSPTSSPRTRRSLAAKPNLL